MTPQEKEEMDIVTFEDEEGHSFDLMVADYFFYNGEEYACLTEILDEEMEELSEDSVYIMKINSFVDENGEEMEEFIEPDEALADKLLEIALTRFEEVPDEEE